MNALKNFIEGEWRPSAATDFLDVRNPATAELLGRVPISPASEVDAAVQAGARAFPNGAAPRLRIASNIFSS